MNAKYVKPGIANLDKVQELSLLYRHRLTLAKPVAVGALLAVVAVRWPDEWEPLMLAVLAVLWLLGLLELGVVVTISSERRTLEPIGSPDHTLEPLKATLEACLDDAAIRVGIQAPALVLISRPPAGATESAQAQTGSTGTSIRVSLASSLLLAPTPDRLTAVLAHELTHLRYHDLRAMAIFVAYATLLLCGAAVMVVIAAAGSGDPLVFSVVILACALAFEPALIALKAAFLRHCEDRADQVAARSCGARTFAEALLLLHAQHVYGEVPESLWPRLLAGRPAGLSGLRINPVLLGLGRDPYEAIVAGATDSATPSERLWSRLRDPHRSDAERVRRLGLNPREVIIGL